MDGRLAGRRRTERSFLVRHPTANSDDIGARVLVIAHQESARRELLGALPARVRARSVRSASDTEGIGTEVVVVGGLFPLAEVIEVRSHPRLFDKPIVLFAPERELPETPWDSMNVWPVTTGVDPITTMTLNVQRLLGAS